MWMAWWHALLLYKHVKTVFDMPHVFDIVWICLAFSQKIMRMTEGNERYEGEQLSVSSKSGRL